MNAWPSISITPFKDLDLPQLKIKDSSNGIIAIDSKATFRMYVCGITPYDATHLGHAATYIAFDLINRYQVLAGLDVHFVENITDVDDPLLVRAIRDNVDWQDLANQQIDLFKSDMSALRVIPPKDFIKVTESLPIIEKFIKKLDSNGFLYSLEGDYYFAVSEFLSTLPMTTEKQSKYLLNAGETQNELERNTNSILWFGVRMSVMIQDGTLLLVLEGLVGILNAQRLLVNI